MHTFFKAKFNKKSDKVDGEVVNKESAQNENIVESNKKENKKQNKFNKFVKKHELKDNIAINGALKNMAVNTTDDNSSYYTTLAIMFAIFGIIAIIVGSNENCRKQLNIEFTKSKTDKW